MSCGASGSARAPSRVPDALEPGASVPARWPFDTLLEPPAELPPSFALVPPGSSIESTQEFPVWKLSSSEGWRILASELTSGGRHNAEFLMLRERPAWAIAPMANDAEYPTDARLLGARVENDRLDDARALELYAWVFCAFIFNLWLTFLVQLWLRQIRLGLESESGARGLWNRLQEELWFSARWVARPATWLLLLCLGAASPGVLRCPRDASARSGARSRTGRADGER